MSRNDHRCPPFRTAPSEGEGPGGFTLLEVLVAFTICALLLGSFLQIFSGGLVRGRLLDDYDMARLHAESLLDALGRTEPLAAGLQAGRIDDRYAWSLSVEPYVEGAERFEQVPIAPYRLTLTLSWTAGDDERSLSLTTLRFAGRI